MNLVVAADDRTGAFETAAAIADRGGGAVRLVAWPTQPTHDTQPAVIDLGSRHLSADEARGRAASVTDSDIAAHKIDSTLRGNWASELNGRHAATGRPVLLIPALPVFGRTCVEGIVLEHGRPVHEGNAGADARRPVTSSRPRDLLQSAGCREVVELADSNAVGQWLSDPRGFAIADADTDAVIAAIVGRWWQRSDVLLAGTSAVIGLAAGRSGDGNPCQGRATGPVLVVCGSLHPVARAQIADARSRGGAHVFVVSPDHADTVADHDSVGMAKELALRASALLRSGGFGALVVIGGDTAAAIVDGADVTVHGSVAPGTALATVDGIDVPVITRAGGFGARDALTELLWSTLQ